MRLVEIAIGTVLRIPDGWTVFTYRGFRYAWNGAQFIRAKVADENNSVLREKTA